MTLTESLGLTQLSIDSLLPIMLIICLLVVLFAGATWYFDNELKYVFFLMTALMAVTGLFLAAQMADIGFQQVSSVLWTLFYIGGLGFFMLLVYVLWKFIEAWNWEKTKKPGLK